VSQYHQNANSKSREAHAERDATPEDSLRQRSMEEVDAAHCANGECIPACGGFA
jgi:hypothetical protein